MSRDPSWVSPEHRKFSFAYEGVSWKLKFTVWESEKDHNQKIIISLIAARGTTKNETHNRNKSVIGIAGSHRRVKIEN